MIFYFTGTGNSLYAASFLAETAGEALVDMGEACKKGAVSYRIHTNEKIGFVFPVYYSGLPTVVADFIRRMNLIAEDDSYVFSVITCGAAAMGADAAFRRLMREVNWHVDCVFSLKMPDNYVMLYNPASKERAEERMTGAKSDLLDIAEDIAREKKGGFHSGAAGTIASGVMQNFYRLFRKTKKFFADECCVSCGLCEKVCPVSAIEMENGKPQWRKTHCAHCTACINRCPQQAIQYGKATKARNRYCHEILQD